MDDSSSGKAVGGKARAAALSPARRQEIARSGAAARKALQALPLATHGSPDHPLKLGDAEISCYVLNDGTRVLSQRGVIGALGMARGSGGTNSGGDRLAGFFGGKGISPFVTNEMRVAIESPIRFKSAGGVTFGYPATLLADICDAVLSARRAGALQNQQKHIAQQAEVLVRGFARVGIIALVDEATGYQRDRSKDALAQILEAFVAKELQPYIKTFPAEFYEHLFRLRGLAYPPEKAQYKPQYFGKLTNDIVYKRLAPGVLTELKKESAKDERKGKLHQRLTRDMGHPKLREHLASVVTVMKLTSSGDQAYADFITKLDIVAPCYGDTMPLALD